MVIEALLHGPTLLDADVRLAGVTDRTGCR
jgi:hypothetical protein